MKLLFERSVSGRRCALLPDCPCDMEFDLGGMERTVPLRLPELSETDVSRHYTELAGQTRGVNNGFYPLGSCTMKYNPKLNEDAAALPGFTGVHPLQPEHTVQGCLEVLHTAERMLCSLTGMDRMSFQPAAGAHGEFTGLLLIKAYHDSRGDGGRTTILIPDSAHGTNPATASMLGYRVASIPSGADGCVDLEALRAAAGPDTAGLMLTNPNTLGLFEKEILSIAEIVHDAGGLVYYDGANLNAVMGIVRPGDMGFDMVHLNLHKTFSTPHGGGGPGSGACGCKEFLAPFLPKGQADFADGAYTLSDPESSVGRVKAFSGNFLVVVRALAYLLSLGREGILEAAKTSVLNANYMMQKLKDLYHVPHPGGCMHEFVLSLEREKRESGVTAMDIAKRLLDYGIHPPTMYFPLIVKEALMVEPTETESKETLDEAIAVLREIYQWAQTHPKEAHAAPQNTPIGRPDEVQAARRPILRYQFSD